MCLKYWNGKKHRVTKLQTKVAKITPETPSPKYFAKRIDSGMLIIEQKTPTLSWRFIAPTPFKYIEKTCKYIALITKI